MPLDKIREDFRIQSGNQSLAPELVDKFINDGQNMLDGMVDVVATEYITEINLIQGEFEVRVPDARAIISVSIIDDLASTQEDAEIRLEKVNAEQLVFWYPELSRTTRATPRVYLPRRTAQYRAAAIISTNNNLVFASSESIGDITITIPNGTYDFRQAAQILQDTLNADDTLTGSGTITFIVTFDPLTRKLKIDSGGGNTIAYTNVGSDAGVTFGLTSDKAAAVFIESDTALDFPAFVRVSSTRIITLMPPADKAYLIKVKAKYRAQKLVDDSDISYWTEEEPAILVSAALQRLAVHYSNDSMIRTRLQDLDILLRGVEYDEAFEDQSDVRGIIA